MPSPIAHMSAGYVIWRVSRPSATRLLPSTWSGWAVLAVAVFFSLLPDIDAAPAFLFNDLGRYHNNLTNSLLLTLIVRHRRVYSSTTLSQRIFTPSAVADSKKSQVQTSLMNVDG